MEKGQPVRIAARDAEALFFYSNDGTPVFIPRGRSVTVKTPGGKYVRGAYKKTMGRFVQSNNLTFDIDTSGIIKRLEVAQATAARQMPIRVTAGAAANTIRRLANQNTARHLKQVARSYQNLGGDRNG